MKDFYIVHMNGLCDLDRHLYMDALLQPVRQRDGFGTFCTMVECISLISGTRDIYIGDRGYCSYNDMAHVIEKGQYFLFCSKDLHSKGILKNLGFPTEGTFDETVTITITRRHSKKIPIPPGGRLRFVVRDISFDYAQYGSDDTYNMTFRAARIQLPSGPYECLITNLPRKEFPLERLSRLYFVNKGGVADLKDFCNYNCSVNVVDGSIYETCCISGDAGPYFSVDDFVW